MHDIEWRVVPFAAGWEDEEPDAVVWIDIHRVDAAWIRTHQYIVPGGANGQDNRYQKFGEWFAVNRHCHMPFASVCEDELLFTDGRHRFMAARPRLESNAVSGFSRQARLFAENFGSMLRRSPL